MVCVTPLPFFGEVFFVFFLWLGSWIRLAGVFFRRKMYFFIFSFVGVICGKWIGEALFSDSFSLESSTLLP